MKPTLGTCYYPEHWDEARWTDDARRMADLGLSWVRLGEFAWSRIEPEPEQFNWGWLDRAIDTLGQAGLKVVLGTPTATPPRWMLDRHPEMLALDAHGQPRGFGSRRHYCFSHLGYRAEARRICDLLGQRYGDSPHVQAWQTDNEYGCHETTISYSRAALGGFQNWLAQKYQSPDALNRAWGNVFWSMDYRSFDQVDLPNLTVTEPNPAHVMDFRRYTSDQVVAFNKMQTDTLRGYTDAPLIHNYMGRVTDFDHFDVGADLDIASWDSYPLGFLENLSEDGDTHKAQYARQGDPDFQAFHHDLYRAVGRGRWWVMEQQPGPVNWAAWNPAPLRGMVRLWTWEAIAHGAEAVCYFRWRQAPFAQEQMHSGLLRTDGQPAPGYAEARKVAGELAEIGDVHLRCADVALVFDYPSCWAWDVQPQGRDFSYFGLVFDMYRGLRRLGLSVEIVSPDSQDLSPYKLVLVPGLFTLSDDFRSALQSSGALVVFGPRCNSKKNDFSIPTPLPPAIPSLDVSVTRVESLRPELSVPLKDGGAVQKWIEHLETSEAAVLETVDGAPVLVQNGSTAYLGGWPDPVAMDRMIEKLCKEAGVATQKLPLGVRIRDTKTFRLVTNYGPEHQKFEGQDIGVGEVLILPAP